MSLIAMKRKNSVLNELEAKLGALDKSQAIIEFNMDGTIITANKNFLDAMGYSLEEVQGRHHSIFVEPVLAQSIEYRQFWEILNRGEYQSTQYKRLGKNGKEVWIQASYNPLMDSHGRPFKVVKFATDITAQMVRNADYEGQIAAISKSQAVIEFKLDGTILNANQNFLDAMGYTLDEVKGRHHSIFVEPAFSMSAEYRQFWEMLNRGEYQSMQYKRLAKGGREIWIQASYNPIMDLNGNPFKVVKFATDITKQRLQNADFQGQISAIGKAQAVIEFRMDGTIINANKNFLDVMGYSLDEIKDRHHSMFVEPGLAQSTEYTQFWDALRRGEYQAKQYKRFGKNGKEVWIQASYNPILDMNGVAFKVVKYATDITEQVNNQEIVKKMISGNSAGAEELSASVQDISKTMSKSRLVADEAYDRVAMADLSTQKLDEASKAMTSVVDLIDNITGQINLLALNATIEAARAGDAGKGFAVVANEVKSLANQAKNANDQISAQIAGLSSISGDVVENLTGIKKSIENLREYVTSTAAAIEEQSAVANEMSANLQAVAQATLK